MRVVNTHTCANYGHDYRHLDIHGRPYVILLGTHSFSVHSQQLALPRRNRSAIKSRSSLVSCTHKRRIRHVVQVVWRFPRMQTRQ